MEALTWSEGGQTYLERYSLLYHSRTTYGKVAQILRDFAEVAQDTPLERITQSHIEDFMALRLKQNKSAWTVYDEVVKIRSVFKWLRLRGHYKGTDPCEGVKMLRRPGLDVRPPEMEAVRLLLIYLRLRRMDLYRHLAILAMNVGLRLREMLRIKSEDVDLVNAVIRVRNIKPPHDVDVLPLNAEALKVLQERIGDHKQGLLFRSKSGKELLRWNVSRRFKSITRKAETPGITFHSLRKLFGSQNGQIHPERVLMRLMRHKSPQSTSHYVRVDVPQPVVVR